MEKRKYKFEVGEVINKSLMIVEQIVLPKKDIKAKTGYSNQKGYKYHCLECGYEAENFEYMLIRGKNCPCCINKVIIPEINSIIAKEETRWMVEYFVNKEEAKLYSPKSSKYIDAKCPYCEERKRVNIQTLYECKSIGCLCSSGSSFGERIVRCFLDELNIEYITEYTPKWFGFGLRRYDFYLPKSNTIIEVHGRQHYEEGKNSKWITFEKQKENDMFKFDMSVINGVDNYIIIDARKSDVSHIKNSILSSKLSDIIDAELNSVEWKDIILKTGNNLIREVCEYYNKTNKSPMEISKIFNIGKSTAINYLKFGNETGLCEYDPVKKSSENGVKYGHIQGIKNGKEVCIYKDGKLLGTFYSMTELSRVSEKLFGVKLAQTSISKAIRNKNVYHGFTFSLSDNN